MKRWMVISETEGGELDVSNEFAEFAEACKHGQRQAREYPHSNYAVYELAATVKVEAAVVPAPDHPEWKGDAE